MSATAGEAAEGAFRVNSLSGLEGADAGSGRLVWDPPRSIWNMGFLVGALILGPMFFSWSAFAAFLILSGFTLCVGHSVGFHRRLIHHTFECPKWLERSMVYIGVLVGMGGPLWTVGLHDIRGHRQRRRQRIGLGAALVAVHDHPHPLVGQRHRDRPTNAAGGAGDQDSLTCEFGVHVLDPA